MGPGVGFRRFGVVGVLAVAAVLGGCGDSGDGAADDEDVVLDLESGQAETEAGTVQAQRADHSYVASIGEGRAIGVTTAGEVGAASEAAGSDEVVVYVYDRDRLAVLTGPVGEDGTASPAGVEGAEFDAAVDLLSVTAEAVSGTVAVADESPVEFTADVATGDAGVYWADGATDDPDVRCDWVVLDEDRQWGCICTPPGLNNPCCHLQRF